MQKLLYEQFDQTFFHFSDLRQIEIDRDSYHLVLANLSTKIVKILDFSEKPPTLRDAIFVVRERILIIFGFLIKYRLILLIFEVFEKNRKFHDHSPPRPTLRFFEKSTFTAPLRIDTSVIRTSKILI